MVLLLGLLLVGVALWWALRKSSVSGIPLRHVLQVVVLLVAVGVVFLTYVGGWAIQLAILPLLVGTIAVGLALRWYLRGSASTVALPRGLVSGGLVVVGLLLLGSSIPVAVGFGATMVVAAEAFGILHKGTKDE
jgi:hypothetical protein